MTDLKFKTGDHVMVPAKVVVARDADGEEYRLQFSNGASVWVDGDDLASATLIERPLAVGDRVVWGIGAESGWPPGTGRILDIDGEDVLVRRLTGQGDTWIDIPLSALRRAEERG